jgi:hypothetical protein
MYNEIYSMRKKNHPRKKNRPTFQSHLQITSKRFRSFFVTGIIFLYVWFTGFRKKTLKM